MPAVEHQVVGSTDMGNVSYVVPSIHPMIKSAPAGTAIHTEAFAGFAASAEADLAVLDGAKAMALTVVDCWTEGSLLATAREQFEHMLGVRAVPT
jgi:metal-dependent amidase/aminoacylase/carboxypeptidase family protein